MGDIAARPALVAPQSQGFLTFDSILFQRGKDNVQKPLLAYPAPKGVDNYELFTGSHLNRLVDGAAKALLKLGFEPTNTESVVGLLAATDLTYLVTIFALGRLGYTAFVLSSRLAPIAIACLLRGQKSSKLIHAAHLLSLASRTAYEYDGLHLIPLLARDQYDHPDDNSPPFLRKDLDPQKEVLKKYVMFHSSGSTGLPKPISHTNGRLMATILTAQPYKTFSSLPLFHAHGFIVLIQAIYNAKTLYLMDGQLPQTHDNVTQAIKKADPEFILTVPYVLKLVAEKRDGIEVLKRAKIVSITGSACPDELGDMLTKEGVFVGSSFGSTEVAQILNSLNRPRSDTAWNYLRPPPHIKPFLLFRPVSGTAYECIVLDGHKGKQISNSDDPPSSYHTSDLFEKHPTIPDAWKFIGRMDDRITLTTGEKVLPLAMEGRIMRDEIVREAVMFGIEREVPGVLIFRAKGVELSKAEFLDRVWPAIEDANSHAEGFSQVSRDMVIVMPEDAECPVTDKASVKRAQVYRDFANVIDAAYATLESLQEGDLKLEVDEMESFIIRLVQGLGVRLEDESSNFFEEGVDSLKAIQLRQLLIRGLDLGGKATAVPSMVVYDCGNAAKLARRLVGIRDGDVRDEEEGDEIAEMQDLIDRFSVFHPREKVVIGSTPKGNAVLLTGATGSLGSHLLSRLVESPQINKVFCIIRSTSILQTGQQRVALTARTRDLPNILSKKTIPLIGDLSEANFNLPVEVFKEIRQEVTHIIHFAWNVNFALPVSAFATQIQEVRNLVALSLSSPFEQPPQVMFSSSVGAAMATPTSTSFVSIPEATISNLRHASPTGYARSKLVAEHILQIAAEKYGARTTVLRVGQIIPAPRTGSQLWNPTEMIPLIIRSALAIGVLPDIPGPSSRDACPWIDVETLAKTVVDIAGLSPSSTPVPVKNNPVYNLVSPVTVSWKTEFLPALRRAGLDFEIVAWGTWLEKLRDDHNDAEDNPSRRLLGFWDGMGDQGSVGANKGGGVVFETAKARERSASLRDVGKVVDGEYVKDLLGAWRSVW